MPEEKDFLEKLEAVLKKLLANNPSITLETISSDEGLHIL